MQTDIVETQILHTAGHMTVDCQRLIGPLATEVGRHVTKVSNHIFLAQRSMYVSIETTVGKHCGCTHRVGGTVKRIVQRHGNL